MSASIVRRGLDLFKDDIEDAQAKKKKKKGVQSTSRQDLLHLISSNKTGVTKQLRRLQGGSQRNKSSVKDRKKKSAFNKLPKVEDQTKRNVDYLLRLDRNRDRFSSQTQQIIDHSRGRLSKDNPLPDNTEPVETSAFSEEDFANFEKNYLAKRKIDNFLLDFQSSSSDR